MGSSPAARSRPDFHDHRGVVRSALKIVPAPHSVIMAL
jgi:hypothetical protein